MKPRLIAAGTILIALLGLAGILAYRAMTPPKLVLTTPVPAGSPTDVYRVYVDPSEYQIVYLITPDAERSQNELLATIPDITQAKVAHDWRQVMSFHSEKSIEAIIIERSAYPLVDKSWTAAMARQGLVIATINLYAGEQIELRDSDCDRRKPPKVSPFPEDYFLVTSHLIYTENPADLAPAIQAAYEDCTTFKSTSRVFETSNGSHSSLKTEEDVKYLTNVIIGAIDTIRDAKASIEMLSSPPTFVPENDTISG